MISVHKSMNQNYIKNFHQFSSEAAVVQPCSHSPISGPVSGQEDEKTQHQRVSISLRFLHHYSSTPPAPATGTSVPQPCHPSLSTLLFMSAHEMHVNSISSHHCHHHPGLNHWTLFQQLSLTFCPPHGSPKGPTPRTPTRGSDDGGGMVTVVIAHVRRRQPKPRWERQMAWWGEMVRGLSVGRW